MQGDAEQGKHEWRPSRITESRTASTSRTSIFLEEPEMLRLAGQGLRELINPRETKGGPCEIFFPFLLSLFFLSPFSNTREWIGI